MAAPEATTQDGVHYEGEEGQEQGSAQEVEQTGFALTEETATQSEQTKTELNNNGDRSGFVHGLSVGLGVGCIAAFVITWITIFFTPQLPSNLTYENMLTVFIYPLVYLLAVGLIALTAGVVREYYAIKR